MTGVKYILDGELVVQKPSDIFKIMQCICSFTLSCVTLDPALTQDFSFAPLMVQMNLAGSCCFFCSTLFSTLILLFSCLWLSDDCEPLQGFDRKHTSRCNVLSV